MRIPVCLCLALVAAALPAQEVIVPEESMREAWSESGQQFESLSEDYDSGYPGRSDSNRWESNQPGYGSYPSGDTWRNDGRDRPKAGTRDNSKSD